MIEANIWYRYKSYSDERPNCYNGFMKLDDKHGTHMMVHYGKLVQLYLVNYITENENLYKNTDIKIIEEANHITSIIIAKKLLINNRFKGIYSINGGEIKKEWI